MWEEESGEMGREGRVRKSEQGMRVIGRRLE